MPTFYENLNAFSERLCSRRSFLGGIAVGGLAGLGGAALAGIGETSSSSSETFPPLAYADEPATADQGKRHILKPYATPSVIFEEEQPSHTKKVLIVVDYQVDFVDGGVFGTIEPALAIEDDICEVIERYRANDDIIIYTMDTHPDDHYSETREGTFNPPHCIPGTEGWELYGKVRGLLNPENAIRVMKGTYGSRDLPTVLQAIQSQGITIESVEFAGVSTTCRVLHNAIIVYNFFPELPLIFDERTTASYSDEMTAEQLDELEGWGFIVKRTSNANR